MLDNETPSPWYCSWFDSEYYHLLYQNRNDQEAQYFITNLIQVLGLPKGSKILDVACGKGRHSIFLSSIGYDVSGFDLSANSIEVAQKSSSDQLHFYVHDMRIPFANQAFDSVLNLFTSIGYFDRDEENLESLKSMVAALKPGGSLVIDYMNTTKIIHALRKEFTQIEGGIAFHIQKQVDKHFIIKKISFEDKGRQFSYQEKVRKLYPQDFMSWFDQLPLKLEHIYGNYSLHPYQEEVSDRQIYILKKI
jgi:SAM-dependent methyltransferase